MQNNRNNLDDELHRILTSYLNNNLNNVFNTRNRPPTTPQYRHRRRNTNTQTHNNNIFQSRERNHTDNTVLLNTILSNLNNNMLQYHENLNSYLNILTEVVCNETVLERFSRTTNNNSEDEDEILPNTTRYFRRPTNPFGSTGIFNPLHTTRPIQTEPIVTYGLSLFPNTTSFQNVVVYPTAEQINRATETLIYSSYSNLPHNTCPISLEDFQEGEQLRRITHCGHIFNENNFNTWFSRNVRCPVCRHDIREVQDISNNTIPTSPITENNINTDPSNNLNENIVRTLSSTFNNIFDSSTNLALHLEIPLEYTETYDMSDNLISREFF